MYLVFYVWKKIYLTRKSQSYFITSNNSQQSKRVVERERQCSRHRENEQSKSDTVDAEENKVKAIQ